MSSKRGIRRKQCQGKRALCNEDHARREAAKGRRRTGDDIRSYRCPHCSWWHIGHHSARKI
ncbi:MAG: hypothetical protein AABZ15_11695 [Nitrospirota bacterium]